MNANLDTLVFPWVPLVWIGGWIAASIVWRRSRGKPIFPGVPPGALFARKGISGASRRDVFTELGGARNCLMVAVTKDRLLITPTFPFNLMFLPEVYDLDYDIPRSDIISVDLRRGVLSPFVIITFRRTDGRTRAVEVRLRNAEDLVAALGVHSRS